MFLFNTVRGLGGKILVFVFFFGEDMIRELVVVIMVYGNIYFLSNLKSDFLRDFFVADFGFGLSFIVGRVGGRGELFGFRVDLLVVFGSIEFRMLVFLL